MRSSGSVWIVTNWYRTQHYYDSGAWRATWAWVKAAACCSIRHRTIWICGSGFAACRFSIAAYCDVARYHHIEVEDEATIFARYANGATGIFITSTGETPGTNRLEISGELGKLVLEDGRLKWWKLSESERDIRFASQQNFVTPPCDYTEIKPTGEETAHAGILRNFVGAILRKEPLLSPGEDGLCELEISNAAYLSQWTGNAPVHLPMDTELFDELLAQRLLRRHMRRRNPKACPTAYTATLAGELVRKREALS